MTDPIEGARWLAESVGVRAMPELAAMRVSGEDARSWLQGQITNDISRTAAGGAVYALAVDVRGKILADLTVVDRGDDFLVLVPADRRAALLEHFDGYIVMEEVDLEPIDDLTVLTAQGPAADAVTAGRPRHPSDRLGAGGFDVLAPSAEADATLAALIEAATEVGGGEVDQAAWELARLRRGVPRYGVDFGGAHYPQEAGLKERARSFLKGCYLGQEVVCMLENRGQLRRRLVRLEGDARPEIGAPIEVDGAAVGEITSALDDPAGGRVRALGYGKRAHAEPGAVVSTPVGPLTVVAPVG